jgi:cysteinyl-tRNA synthetase
MHGNMLILNGKKMAKSTGNYILPDEIMSGNNKILSKPYPATVARFFMLQAHYRSILDFSNDALEAAEKGYNRLMNAVNLLDEINPGKSSTLDIITWKKNCYEAMNDDFNSPILIAQLFEAVKIINTAKEGTTQLDQNNIDIINKTMHDFIFDVLALEENNTINSGDDHQLSDAVNILIGLRNQARDNKDFQTSDLIRDQLKEAGIHLKDGKEGTTFSLNL